MHWGQRKATASGISSHIIDREAQKDAKEYIQAKLYYGQGAGTRRKLIKAKIEGKSAKNADYAKAVEFHKNNQDIEKQLGKVKGQRARATARATTAKTSRGIINTIRGNPQAAGASVAAAASVAILIHKTGLDKKAYYAVKNSSAGQIAIKNGAAFVRRFL
jgi:N-acetyl-gamma-glutamylphosphate reductase